MERAGDVIQSELSVHAANRGLHTRLNGRLVGEVLADALRAAVEDLPGRDRIAESLSRIGHLEETHQKVGHLRRRFRLQIRTIALTSDPGSLERHHYCNPDD